MKKIKLCKHCKNMIHYHNCKCYINGMNSITGATEYKSCHNIRCDWDYSNIRDCEYFEPKWWVKLFKLYKDEDK